MPSERLATVYYAFIHSILNYSVVLYASTTEKVAISYSSKQGFTSVTI